MTIHPFLQAIFCPFFAFQSVYSAQLHFHSCKSTFTQALASLRRAQRRTTISFHQGRNAAAARKAAQSQRTVIRIGNRASPGAAATGRSCHTGNSTDCARVQRGCNSCGFGADAAAATGRLCHIGNRANCARVQRGCNSCGFGRMRRRPQAAFCAYIHRKACMFPAFALL